MSRIYPGEDFDDAADRLADEDVQRGLDERMEAEAKRRASGVSAEQVGLMAAAEEGREAGRHGAGASMNPYTGRDNYKAAEWERWRMLTLGERFNGKTRRVA